MFDERTEVTITLETLSGGLKMKRNLLIAFSAMLLLLATVVPYSTNNSNNKRELRPASAKESHSGNLANILSGNIKKRQNSHSGNRVAM